MKNYAGLMALSIFASNVKIPVYSGGQFWRGCGKFDANEIKKARKQRAKKKKR